MPSKLQTYMQMADEAQRQITGSYRGWTGFLTTAARLYKYPYAEQVMIHAQRPDATACAEYDFWNEKMGRYVRRGSKGIALIDSSGERPRLRYVFDVSDTGGREFPKSRYLWEYRAEHADAVSAMLESRYGADGKGGLPDQLERIASQLAEEYWRDYKRDILAIVDDSFLYGYDEFNVGAAFQSAAAVSIAYSLMSRCGLEADDRFEHEDFLSIFDFNTPEAAAELGTAVSRINGEVLRQIEVTIKNYEREKLAERSHSHDRTDLHQERGLPDSRPDTERNAGGRETPGQVRETAQELPSGAQTGAVQPSGAVGEAVPASAGDRRDGEPEAGADDAGADEVGGRDGGAESPRSDEMGGADEQPESAGGGDHSQRAGVQLTNDAPEAEPAQPPIPQAYQLSLFPTEEEQIAYIAEAESYTPSAFSMSIPQADIDHILRMEGNADYARMKIATEFSKGKSVEEIAAFLQSSFHGGNGVVTENGRYSAWYAEDGIHIANGDAARYLTSAKVVSWQEAAERIGQLLEQGEYATNVELAEAPGHERAELAQAVWYLRQDLSEKARAQGYLSCLSDMRGGGFPEETARLAERLIDPAFREVLMDDFAQLRSDYREDRSLLRFHYHKPDKIEQGLRELSLPRREYRTEMAEIPAVQRFITEDEIAATLTRGSNIEGSKGRIYAYFKEKKERFMANFYDADEVNRLFEISKGTKLEIPILFGAFYGMRRSETLGMKWDAIDFERDTITIRHTLTTVALDGKRITVAEDRTKNKSSMRTLPLVPFVKERLLELKAEQEENRRLCGRSYVKDYTGYVCINEIGDIIKPNYVSCGFPKLLEEHGLRRVRYHDLRHSCASLLLANGVPMKQIQEWLGHSDFSTTANIYAHLDYSSKLTSADAMLNGLGFAQN